MLGDGYMKTEEKLIIAKIIEKYGELIQGMTSNDDELILKINNKDIKVLNHINKTPEEVVQEIKDKLER